VIQLVIFPLIAMVMFIDVFPYTNRFIAFRPSGLFSAYPCSSVTIYALAKKLRKSTMVARTRFKDTLQVQCLCWLLTNSNTTIKPGTLLPVQVTAEWSVSGFQKFYEKCQILQRVHEFEMCVTALEQGQVEYGRIALHLTSSSSTQIHTSPDLS
jgi:hypothetical protein